MGFLDKARGAAEQAKVKAQEGVEGLQAKKELTQAYWDLGHKTYHLAVQGAVSNPELDPLIQRIRELEAGDGSPGAPSGAGFEPEQATESTPPQSPA